MKTRILTLLSALVPCMAPTPASAEDPIRAEQLRCEYLSEPSAVDETHSRLSWAIQADDPALRGVRQAAYQIRAAGSKQSLLGGQADLWDTGRVVSDETQQIVYAGKPLKAGQECWWQVTVFGPDGSFTTTSAPSRWSAGATPLSPSSGPTQWLFQGPPTESKFLGASLSPERRGWRS
jgi:alpha-L-rhamnosidase